MLHGAVRSARSSADVLRPTPARLIRGSTNHHAVDGDDLESAPIEFPDFVLAGALLGGTGLLLVQAVKKANSVAYRTAAVAIGVAAIVLGEADDAPGLVGFGLLLIAATVALTVRTALRSE